MNAIGRIVEYLNSITHTFYNAYLETRGWIYPFSLVAGFFLTLSTISNSIAWQVYSFYTWVDEVTGKIGKILSYENIASHFKSFLNSTSEALGWVRGAFKNVISIVDTWWEETKLTIWSRIDIAKEALQSRINALGKTLGTIQETISSLKALIPTKSEVLTWITSLIDTRTKELKPFWDGWLEMKSQVVEFFTDPGKWFMDRIEGWVERFW
ncbi:unnamed protein product [marine sediment metagenome]|uniref:Uncharacterized protein n=1 Tax=marine sediment metagenome TaxID=412755 RepID=X1TBN6_9ZZZZ